MGGALRAELATASDRDAPATMRSTTIFNGDLQKAEVRARCRHREVLRPHRPDGTPGQARHHPDLPPGHPGLAQGGGAGRRSGCSRPTEGTPQGGVADSPLLDERRAARTGDGASGQPSPATSLAGNGDWAWQPIVVRYADDFVVLHEDRDVIEQSAARSPREWLTGDGAGTEARARRGSRTP